MTSGTTCVSFDPRPGPGPSAVQPTWIRALAFPWRGVTRSIASTHRHGNPRGTDVPREDKAGNDVEALRPRSAHDLPAGPRGLSGSHVRGRLGGTRRQRAR